jgi:hypothetical protein
MDGERPSGTSVRRPGSAVIRHPVAHLSPEPAAPLREVLAMCVPVLGGERPYRHTDPHFLYAREGHGP